MSAPSPVELLRQLLAEAADQAKLLATLRGEEQRAALLDAQKTMGELTTTLAEVRRAPHLREADRRAIKLLTSDVQAAMAQLAEAVAQASRSGGL